MLFFFTTNKSDYDFSGKISSKQLLLINFVRFFFLLIPVIHNYLKLMLVYKIYAVCKNFRLRVND